jgi:hypothetical protein
MISTDPLPEAGGQRRAGLHDRALPADGAAGADAQRGRQRLDRGDLRADPPPALGDGDDHLGHAVPAGLAGVPADQRDQHEEAQPQESQVRAGHAALLAELIVTGRQPGKQVDQVPEPDRPQPRSRAHQQRDSGQAAPRPPQPAARRPSYGLSWLSGSAAGQAVRMAVITTVRTNAA